MGAVLVINVSGVETRVALVENGTISEYYLERKKDKGIVGNIYKGRVVRVLPGMQAAFVDIGLDKAAFLYVNDVFYDPDFSEQQFELTEGEHAEFDDELDDRLELGAGPDPAAKTPLPEEEAPRLSIVAPALLGTPGELKTPRALNGSVAHCQCEGAPAALDASAGASAAAVEPSSCAADVGGSARAPQAGPGECGSGDLPAPERPCASQSEAQARTPVAAEAAGEVPVAEAESVEAAVAVPLPAEVSGVSTEAAAAREEVAATTEEEADKSSGEEAIERRGELRARARRKRRGGSARRELRHGEAEEREREERQDSEGAVTATGAQAAEISEGDLGDAAPDALPAPAGLPLASDGAREVCAPLPPPEEDVAQGSAEAPVSGVAPVPSDDVAAPEGAAPGGEDPTPAAEAPVPAADKACAAEQERTPVAESRGNGRHGGRYGERGRRGGRAAAAEAKAGERGSDDASERSEADNGRAFKRRPAANIQDLLKVGQEIIVQVAKDPIGTKGARVTSHISIPGRQIVFMPTVDHVGISRRIEKESERRRLREIVERIRPPGTGFIVRTVAENISTEKLEADARFLIGIWSEVVAKKDKIGAPALLHPDLDLTLRATRDLFVQDVEKLVIDDRAEWERISRFVAAQAPALRDRVVLHESDEPIFDAYGIEHELQRAYSRKVWLKSGGYLIIDQAEALTAIDVNSGRYVGKKSLEETITRINIEAAKEIVYQLRLRNIGGIMIIDFIDMAKAQNRDKVFKALQEALGRDKARTNILKISELGLIEMTRKRVRESLGRTLNEPCSYCDGRGYLKSKQTMAYEIFREIRRGANNFKEGAIVVNCHPDVARILQVEEREELRYLMDRFNKTIVVRPQQSYHQEQFEIYGKAERQPRSRAERDSERRHEREQRHAEQGSLRLTADRAPLRKPGDPQPERKPAVSPLEEPQGRLAEYPPPPEKSGSQP